MNRTVIARWIEEEDTTSSRKMSMDGADMFPKGTECVEEAPHHPNVAAVLGNQGNLQKEMGDFDSAYNTYVP